MTATVPELPCAVLKKVTGRILVEVPGVCRVLYDLMPQAEGDYQRAQELLAHAKSTLNEDEYQKIFHELEEKVIAGQAASDECSAF